jgi:hypothetical protein
MRISQVGPFRHSQKDFRREDSVVASIRAEFAGMPCMRLTRAQFRRLWHLTPTESERLVGDLIAIGFLTEDDRGRIGRRPERY